MPSRLTRRAALGLPAALPLAGGAAARTRDAGRAAWTAFRDRFVTPEGRVVDTGNGDISHSEGQGWSLLFAVRSDDRAAFGRVLAWTRRTLGRPRDMLHSWRFRPGAARPVDDPNNATDGDLCIAWALLEAGRRWGVADHAALGAAIGRDVLRLLLCRAGGLTLLLPGARGFEHPGRIILNPSYYVFPALGALARAVPDPAWVHLAADGLTLLRRGRFGRWGLPPDWLQLATADAAVTLPQGWPPRFSYDAVRVPLWLAWAGLAGEPALAAASRFWFDPAHRHLPAWTDLTTDSVSAEAASPGIASIARLCSTQPISDATLPPEQPSKAKNPDYYSVALSLLAEFAAKDVKFPQTR